MNDQAVTNAALDQLLTRRQRRTCVLAWVERRTHVEIAALQGISHWGSKKRVQRARRRLEAANVVPLRGKVATRRTPARQLSGIENV